MKKSYMILNNAAWENQSHCEHLAFSKAVIQNDGVEG